MKVFVFGYEIDKENDRGRVCSKTSDAAKQRELEGSRRPLAISATSVCIFFLYNGALPSTL